MVAGASLVPDGLKHQGSVLRLSPDPAGPQHNEQAGSILTAGVRHLPVDPETGESASPMHKSVYKRFETDHVLLYDRMAPYRPDNMRVHVDFRSYFDHGTPPLPKCVADDLEFEMGKSRPCGPAIQLEPSRPYRRIDDIDARARAAVLLDHRSSTGCPAKIGCDRAGSDRCPTKLCEWDPWARLLSSEAADQPTAFCLIQYAIM